MFQPSDTVSVIRVDQITYDWWPVADQISPVDATRLVAESRREKPSTDGAKSDEFVIVPQYPEI
jgi:hypothetical protein